MCGDFAWRVFDCEELVGINQRLQKNLKAHPQLSQPDRRVIVPKNLIVFK